MRKVEETEIFVFLRYGGYKISSVFASEYLLSDFFFKEIESCVEIYTVFFFKLNLDSCILLGIIIRSFCN